MPSRFTQVNPEAENLDLKAVISSTIPLISPLTMLFLQASMTVRLSHSKITFSRLRLQAKETASRIQIASATREEPAKKGLVIAVSTLP